MKATVIRIKRVAKRGFLLLSKCKSSVAENPAILANQLPAKAAASNIKAKSVPSK